jgi:hypothetical protein
VFFGTTDNRFFAFHLLSSLTGNQFPQTSRILLDHRRNAIARLGNFYPGLLNPLNLQLTLVDRDFNESGTFFAFFLPEELNGLSDYEVLLSLDENTPTQVYSAASMDQINRLPEQQLDEDAVSREPLVCSR